MSEVVRLVSARIYEVAGGLEGDTSNASVEWRERRALLLELTDREGRVGQGEASPLPGFSSDTLDECRTQLLRVDWSKLPDLASGDGLADALEAALVETKLQAAAARFATETALLDLCGQASGLPVHRLLSATGQSRADAAVPLHVPLAALLTGDVMASAEECVAEGYRWLKLKVGRAPAEEVVILRALRATLGDGIGLRADANGSLDPGTAREWLRAVADLGLEFVEEPLPLARLPDVLPFPVPIAIDESVEAGDDAGLAAALGYGCRYVVLKPGYQGGALRCLHLAAEARRGGALPVVSHLFDGPVALAAAAELALALSPGPAAGLAPHTGLSIWPDVELPAYARAAIRSHERPGLGLPPLSRKVDAEGWREIHR